MLKTIILGTFVLIATFVFNRQDVLAANEAVSSANLRQASKTDQRIEKLRKFLDSHNSPLLPYAETLVETADRYELDWRLVPAITGVESSFGKAIPFSSYNAYGWANGAYYFQSWEDSIEIVTKALKENYLNKGADTVEKIAPIYAPPSQTWAFKVRYFMEKIENFTLASPLALDFTL